MNIITLNYKSTNCYLVPVTDGWLLMDAGWPDTLSQFLQLLNQNGVLLNDINYMVLTHLHPGHAGLTQNLKEFGARLILHNCQAPFVNKINAFFKKTPSSRFKDITFDHSIIMNEDDSRSFLKEMGLDGALLPTPGHSEDSISLVLDGGFAFTGDLPALDLAEACNDPVIMASWEALKACGVKRIYPGHGDAYDI